MSRTIGRLVVCFTTIIIIMICFKNVCYADIVDSGECGAAGSNVTWTLDDGGVVQISGYGAIKDYDNDHKSPFERDERIREVIIDNGITQIGSNAFYGCLNLRRVSIPNGVTMIKHQAFGACFSLDDVEIPKSVTLIDCAFPQCDGITSIKGDCSAEGSNVSWELDGSGILTIYGDGAMKDYVVKYEDVELQNNTFYELFPRLGLPIKSVVVCDGVTSVGDYAFEYAKLEGISLPDTVTKIGECAFCDCKFETIELPSNLTSIGYRAFNNCNSLKSINIPRGVTSIEGSTFSGCEKLENVDMSGNLKTIGDWAFYKCANLQHIEIPLGVTSIGSCAFVGSGISSIVIPDKVQRIEDNVFNGCSNLEKIYISASVTYIDESAFWDCESLMDVYYQGTIDQWMNIPNSSYYSVFIDGDSSYIQAALYMATKHYNSTLEQFGYTYETDPIINAEGEIINLKDVIDDYSLFDYIKTVHSTEYDPKLSYILAGLSWAAYDKTNIVDSLKKLGFKKIYSYCYDSGNIVAAHCIAQKKAGDGSKVVLVALRGTKETNNWLSDLNFNTDRGPFGGYHVGFKMSENTAYDDLKTFLGGSIDKENTTYIITGHSLGGATANLLSLQLTDEGVPITKVYNYNFGCPDVAKLNWSDWNPDGSHDNMFNIADARDIVSVVPGACLSISRPVFQWGKFGRSIWFSHNWNNLDMINIDWSFNAHIKASNYLTYLKKYVGIDEYKSWWDVHGSRLMNISNTLMHIFECPVDVAVYDSHGVLVASVINNEPNYYESKFEDVQIFVEGDKKTICLPENNEYTIKLLGTDTGEMTYSVVEADINRQEMQIKKVFEDVKLDNGKRMQTVSNEDSQPEEIKLFVVDNNEKTIAEIKENGEEVSTNDENGNSESKKKLYNGYTFDTMNGKIKIISLKNRTARFIKAKNKKTVTVPAKVSTKGKVFKIVQVGTKAFKGKKIRTVIIGKNVKKMWKGAFTSSVVKSLIIKTKLLKKITIKGSLKKSKVKMVKVKVGSKKQNKRYVRVYRKIFTKKNTGRKVVVK